MVQAIRARIEPLEGSIDLELPAREPAHEPVDPSRQCCRHSRRALGLDELQNEFVLRLRRLWRVAVTRVVRIA